MRTEVGKYTVGSRVIDVSWEPPRERTVMLNQSPWRHPWPGVTFAVVRRTDGKFIALLAAFSDRAPKGLGDDCLYNSRWWSNIGRGVCLGDKAFSLVDRGRLDPIDAFWNTGFHAHDTRVVLNKDLGKVSMHDLIDTTLHGGVPGPDGPEPALPAHWLERAACIVLPHVPGALVLTIASTYKVEQEIAFGVTAGTVALVLFLVGWFSLGIAGAFAAIRERYSQMYGQTRLPRAQARELRRNYMQMSMPDILVFLAFGPILWIVAMVVTRGFRQGVRLL